ncbi:hypothetical protein HMPREF1640_09980 [Prevotella sp. S7-1-8]|uniref:hypothetical protein n=1 Tax=Prevotella sp. S7-1-8 TaxID=1284775 RepID=UPI00050E561D|nr:hypothetical protein [Prevotella sp. S7-1-8]KGF16423.1 hypothetical protein HMPREF1640_09980 [Prevotella sp. S7-1-8]
MKHHKSTIERTKMLRSITERYYEAGNNRRCYKAIWKRYINPIYPMCYRTYLNYLNIPTTPPKVDALQLTLFDYFDNQ